MIAPVPCTCDIADSGMPCMAHGRHARLVIDWLQTQLDYVKQRMEVYEDALREIAERPRVELNPDGVDQAAWSMQLIACEALGLPLDSRDNTKS